MTFRSAIKTTITTDTTRRPGLFSYTEDRCTNGVCRLQAKRAITIPLAQSSKWLWDVTHTTVERRRGTLDSTIYRRTHNFLCRLISYDIAEMLKCRQLICHYYYYYRDWRQTNQKLVYSETWHTRVATPTSFLLCTRISSGPSLNKVCITGP